MSVLSAPMLLRILFFHMGALCWRLSANDVLRQSVSSPSTPLNGLPTSSANAENSSDEDSADLSESATIRVPASETEGNEDVEQSQWRSEADKLYRDAFRERHLLSAHQETIILDPDMQKEKRFKRPSGDGEAGDVEILGVHMRTSPPYRVRHFELAPATEEGMPAEYNAYVDFGGMLTSEQIDAIPNLSFLAKESLERTRWGGMLHFATKADLDKGKPMKHVSLFVRHPAGRISFKEGVRLEETPVGDPEDPSSTSRWRDVTNPLQPNPVAVALGESQFTEVRCAWLTPNELKNQLGTDHDAGFVYAMRDAMMNNGYHYVFYEFLPSRCKIASLNVDTPYSTWIKDNFGSKQALEDMPVEETLVVVVGMQTDFTSKSFGQPCQFKQNKLVYDIAQFVRFYHSKGGTILTALDWHPQDHCSFSYGCNNFDNRYVATMPPHSTFKIINGQTWPRLGARLNPVVAHALQGCAEADRARMHVVFKGFKQDMDSSSAMPMLLRRNGKTSAEKYTGGFALSANKTWSPSCYGPYPVLPNARYAKCFPTVEQLEEPRKKMTRVRNMKDIYVAWKRIIVVGLHWDMGVKDTAINARKAFPLAQVVVPVDLARVASEGAPIPKEHLPPQGFGTAEAIVSTHKEYMKNDIVLARVWDFLDIKELKDA